MLLLSDISSIGSRKTRKCRAPQTESLDRHRTKFNIVRIRKAARDVLILIESERSGSRIQPINLYAPHLYQIETDYWDRTVKK